MQKIKFLLIFSFISLTSCSHVDEETPRSLIARIAADTSTHRETIAKELLLGQRNSLAGNIIPVEINTVKPANIDLGWITKDGTIIIYSKSPEVVLVIEPTVNAKTVTWSCIVHPATAKPNVCP